MCLKRLTVGAAAFAAACVCLAADPWPSYELVANGDFEAGTVFTNNGGNYLESLTGNNNANIPGWTLANCVKAKANGTYIASGLPIGTYAICLKTNSGSPSSFYQDVTVPAPGVYRISFQWVARPGGKYNQQDITVSFSQVVDGSVSTANVLTTFKATTINSLTAYHRTIDVKAAGTYRLLFSGTSSVDCSTAFDNVSVRKIDNLLENGFFDSGSACAFPYYSTGAGYSNPGWTVNAKCGLDSASGTWVASGRDVGAYAMFIQSNPNEDGVAYQDVTIEKPGLYTLAFDYAMRPGSQFAGQTAKVYFGKVGEGKSDVDEGDLLETLSPASDVFTSYSRPVAVLSAGTYRLKFVGTSSADKATAYDNVRLFASEELITNGEFEEGSFSVSKEWGAYANFANYSNPGWQVNKTDRVGLGCPFGTWLATGLEVGKYAMFIQTDPTAPASGDVAAWQDFAVSAPGTYRVALNYVARGGQYTGQTIKISFGLIENGEIVHDLIDDQFTTTTSAVLTPYEKYITVETVGTYRIQFTAFEGTKDCATCIDCVSVRRQTEYCFWTGGGDGTTISDPANWGRAVLSPVDDLCFTNDTALAVSMPADFTASSLNFFGTGSVTVNGSGAGGDAAKTLTIGKIVSTSSAANTFNCPVAFTTDYNVNSAGPVEFANGVTAAGWGAVDGAGGLRLAGTSFTFTADTVTLDDNVTLAAGAKLSAKTLTGASGQTLTIESGARVELSGDLVTGEGANSRLGVAMADGAELAVAGTVYVWYNIFTSTRKYGTVWANGIVLDVRNNNLGFYAKRINLGPDGISFNGSTGSLHMDIGLDGAAGTYVFGAYADWTWNDGGNAYCNFYQNDVKFDTLDCIDGETPRTITIAKASNNTAAKLYKLNPGTLVLAAPQYFTGGTFLEGGKIVVSAVNGSGTGPATLAAGTTLEVAEGGVLGNATVSVPDGATLTFKDGSGLSCAVEATGAVTVAGNVSFAGGASIALAEGGSFAFEEGAKISIGTDMKDCTLITGSGLTAAQLAEHFETPSGAVRLNDAGDVVYVNAFEWKTALAGEDTYFKYGVAAAASVLVGATCDDSGIARYSEDNVTTKPSATTPSSVLTDGDVHLAGQDANYLKIYALVSGSVEWSFAATDIAQIAVFSRWGDGGRDGVVVESVYVKGDGSDEWSQIMVVPVSVGTGDNASSAGGICAVLRRVDGAPLARGVTGLKIVFPTGQDNGGAGYSEVVAYASVPAEHAYTWSNAAGNKLFSDAGNWTDDATGAAAGPAGSAFEPTCFDALSFPASADVVVDKPATVCSVALNSGVVLGNPDGGAKNTLSFCRLSNAGTGTATVSCGAEFVAGYEVSLQGPVDFAGGATAWSLGISLDASTSEIEHTFRGDITFRDSLGIPNEAPTWTVPSGSRLVAAGLEKKRRLNGHVNGSPAMRIADGGSARFGYVTVGRDNVYLSVQGEMEVDGIYSVRSVYNNNGNFEGNFGYVGDEAFAGSVIRADGLLRPADSQYNCYDVCVYPANLYIGGQGICQATAHNGIKFVGCAKKVYATADFTIRGPDASSGLLALEADAEFDTQGHTVTWTSGISGAATLTKKGEGTLVMSPAAGTSAFTGSVVVNGGTLAISNDVLTATSISLAKGAAIAVGANRTVPAAGVVTASGAARVVVTGDMSEAKPGDVFPLFANCTAETFARLRIDSSNLQSLPRKYGVFLKRNDDGSVSGIISERGLIIYLR